MKRVLSNAGVCISLVLVLGAPALPHDGHNEFAPAAHGPIALVPGDPPQDKTTGQGKLTFRYRPLTLPAAMQAQLVHAHGGFAVDLEANGGDGSAYFSLKGVGLMRITPDLGAIQVLGGEAVYKDVNLHNTCVFHEDGATYLALPSDEAQRVFLTTTAGRLLRTFPNPYGDDKARPFHVCDVEYVEGTLFAANGYADNVCFTCNPFLGTPEDPAAGVWSALRFGGAGTTHGLFGTAHGITRVPGTNVFTIADRANSRLESFTTAGRYIGGIVLPAGALPCDVSYWGSLSVVACLEGPGGSTPAPIYIFDNGNLVSEINIGKDLAVPGFTHVHNAAFRVLRDADGKERIFILAYGWNPGGFAILEQVPGTT